MPRPLLVVVRTLVPVRVPYGSGGPVLQPLVPGVQRLVVVVCHVFLTFLVHVCPKELFLR